MALREEDVWQSGEKREPDAEAIDESFYDDWFWRPLKRYQTRFVEPRGQRSAWRESGRRLQIANRVASHVDSKQARLAYLYEREGGRGSASREETKRKKGHARW